jgi:hypothetical protein
VPQYNEARILKVSKMFKKVTVGSKPLHAVKQFEVGSVFSPLSTKNW